MNIIRAIGGHVGANCFIVESGEEALVIDPSALEGLLLEYATNNKNKITKILLTHRHFDHVLGVAELKKLCNNTQIIIHELDKDGLISRAHSLAEHFGYSQTPVEPDVLCKDGDSIPFGDTEIKVLHTPGHTAGSVCYLIDNVMFSGDTLFKGDIGRQDFPTGDSDAMFASLEKLKSLDKNYKVYPGHGINTTLFAEIGNNPAMNGGGI